MWKVFFRIIWLITTSNHSLLTPNLLIVLRSSQGQTTSLARCEKEEENMSQEVNILELGNPKILSIKTLA